MSSPVFPSLDDIYCRLSALFTNSSKGQRVPLSIWRSCDYCLPTKLMRQSRSSCHKLIRATLPCSLCFNATPFVAVGLSVHTFFGTFVQWWIFMCASLQPVHLWNHFSALVRLSVGRSYSFKIHPAYLLSWVLDLLMAIFVFGRGLYKRACPFVYWSVRPSVHIMAQDWVLVSENEREHRQPKFYHSQRYKWK